MNFETFLADFQKAKENLEGFVVVTFVNAQGSAPQEMGARMIVSQEGYFSGTVGGGKLENAAIEMAKKALEQKKIGSFFQQWNLQTDLGMSCGGVVSLFFEIHEKQAAWQVVIFGAGHVSQELVRVLSRLECNIICIDSRKEWLEKLPTDSQVQTALVNPMEDYVPRLKGDEFVLIMTMGHSTDLPILDRLLKAKTQPYVGAIGSDLKAKKLKNGLIGLGNDTKKVESIFCPMGEDIGNNTPSEIAISITAQILRIRDKFRQKES